MSKNQRRYLIAYDVCDDRRRSRIATVLQSYGHRLQYSLFQVDASPARLERLTAQLEKEISSKEDSILVCDMGIPDSRAFRDIVRLGSHLDIPSDGAIVI